MNILAQTVRSLSEHIKGIVTGEGALEIGGAATLSDAVEGQVSFLANMKYMDQVVSSKASVIIVSDKFDIEKYRDKTFIQVSDPYFAFMQVVVMLHGHREHPAVGISEKADIHSTCEIATDVDIHAFVSIGAGTKIGKGTKIYANCTIGSDVVIGEDCILYPSVTIYEQCQLGDRVRLHASCVIGQDGFGYATHEGRHNKIPQVGAVLIGNDVEMGASCTIDRGTLGNTEVGAGTKFSNSVTVGHNTKIGKGCLVVAQTGFAGSCHIGDYCVFGGQVGIVGHIKLGKGVTVGVKSCVYNDIEAGQTILGIPAINAMTSKRQLLLTAKLPEFKKKLRDLDEAVRTALGKKQSKGKPKKDK